MKIVYNTELDSSRIISIDILDRETKSFEPLDRLKLYKFATDSYLCSAYDPYPSLLGSDTLVVEGEQPGKCLHGGRVDLKALSPLLWMVSESVVVEE